MTAQFTPLRRDMASMGEAPDTDTPRATLPPSFDLAAVERRYGLRDRDAVAAYLQTHQKIVPVLLEAYGHLRARFPRSEISLRVETDYNESGIERHLVVSIATDLEPTQAVGKLHDFYRAWWLTNSARARGSIVFSLE